MCSFRPEFLRKSFSQVGHPYLLLDFSLQIAAEAMEVESFGAAAEGLWGTLDCVEAEDAVETGA